MARIKCQFQLNVAYVDAINRQHSHLKTKGSLSSSSSSYYYPVTNNQTNNQYEYTRNLGRAQGKIAVRKDRRGEGKANRTKEEEEAEGKTKRGGIWEEEGERKSAGRMLQLSGRNRRKREEDRERER